MEEEKKQHRLCCCCCRFQPFCFFAFCLFCSTEWLASSAAHPSRALHIYIYDQCLVYVSCVFDDIPELVPQTDPFLRDLHLEPKIHSSCVCARVCRQQRGCCCFPFHRLYFIFFSSSLIVRFICLFRNLLLLLYYYFYTDSNSFWANITNGCW